MRRQVIIIGVLLTVATATTTMALRRLVVLGPPASPAVTRLKSDLLHPRPAPRGLRRKLIGAVFTVPDTAGAISSLTLTPVQSHRGGAASIATPTTADLTDVLNRKGLYLSVQASNGAFLSALRLVDPRAVRTEDLGAPAGPRAYLFNAPVNAFAARIPYARLGHLALFETDGAGNVSRVYFYFFLDPIAPPKGGATYDLVTG
jgi:hypothetical protein